jgi:hypothetical protein
MPDQGGKITPNGTRLAGSTWWIDIRRWQMGEQTVRFYGLPASLLQWRELLAGVVGREGTEIRTLLDNFKQERHYFEVTMTEADRQAMMAYWYAECGSPGTKGGGQSLRWNDCISFEIVHEQS